MDTNFYIKNDCIYYYLRLFFFSVSSFFHDIICKMSFEGDTSPTHTHSVAMGITTMFHVSHAGVVPGAAVAVVPPGTMSNPNIQPIGQPNGEHKGF